jgi:hypothetical protein
MGTEFIAKTRKSAKKYLDRRRAELCAPDLFKADPETLSRQFLANTEGKADLHPGDALQIVSEGSGIILRREGRVVGRNDCPSVGLKRVVAKAGGFFPGAVSSVHKISATFEFCVATNASSDRAHA